MATLTYEGFVQSVRGMDPRDIASRASVDRLHQGFLNNPSFWRDVYRVSFTASDRDDHEMVMSQGQILLTNEHQSSDEVDVLATVVIRLFTTREILSYRHGAPLHAWKIRDTDMYVQAMTIEGALIKAFLNHIFELREVVTKALDEWDETLISNPSINPDNYNEEDIVIRYIMRDLTEGENPTLYRSMIPRIY